MPSQPQPSATGPAGWEEKESISRTMIYKKVTKPLLERQRRARINRCLDELKELMSSALAAEGENLTKLEKADVLEFTVRHLHQLQREGELSLAATANGLFGAPLHPRSGFQAVSSGSVSMTDRRRYQGGFLACAQQVASYIMKNQDLEAGISQRLLAHLARCAQQISDFPLPTPSPQAAGVVSFPVAGPPPEALVSFPAFPQVAASSDPVYAAPRQEYAITAQFQLYRNKPEAPTPIPLGNESPTVAVEVPRTDEPVKRKAESPIDSIPRIPKKKYAHCHFPDPAEDKDSPNSSNLDENPKPGTSTGETFYVVESKILELSAAHNSKEDHGDDNMWRPW